MFEKKEIVTLLLSDEETFFCLLEKFTEKILAQQKKEPEWISNEREVMEILGIKSKTTLGSYRNNGLIAYSRVGTKNILYRRSSLYKLIEKNEFKTF